MIEEYIGLVVIIFISTSILAAIVYHVGKHAQQGDKE